jgi:hypothetical protein
MLIQEMLLRPQYRPGSTNPDPPYKVRRSKLIVLHGVTRNKRARSAEPRLTVHRDHTFVLFGESEELLDDVHAGAGPVGEVQVDVVDVLFGEPVGLVRAGVEAHHVGYAEFFEDWHVVGGGVCAVLRENK